MQSLHCTSGGFSLLEVCRRWQRERAAREVTPLPMKEANIDPRPEMKDHRTCAVSPESIGNLELKMMLSIVASILVEYNLKQSLVTL